MSDRKPCNHCEDYEACEMCGWCGQSGTKSVNADTLAIWTRRALTAEAKVASLAEERDAEIERLKAFIRWYRDECIRVGLDAKTDISGVPLSLINTRAEQAEAEAKLITKMREHGVDPQVVADAYGWTIANDGELHGLTAGDQGYEPSGLRLDHWTTEWLKKLEQTEAELEKLRHQPLNLPADRAEQIRLAIEADEEKPDEAD